MDAAKGATRKLYLSIASLVAATASLLAPAGVALVEGGTSGAAGATVGHLLGGGGKDFSEATLRMWETNLERTHDNLTAERESLQQIEDNLDSWRRNLRIRHENLKWNGRTLNVAAANSVRNRTEHFASGSAVAIICLLVRGVYRTTRSGSSERSILGGVQRFVG